MTTAYVIGGDPQVSSMLARAGIDLLDKSRPADILVWTGGADVDPKYYGHTKHPSSYCAPDRDDFEMAYYRTARKDQLKVGICRGSQFLCVANGGTLYQDVDNHAIFGTHVCRYQNEFGGTVEFDVTSTHHQMQNPYLSQDGSKLNFRLWGSANLSSYRVSTAEGDYDEDHRDVEIVYWPDSHSLGFQGHPEYKSEQCRELFFICLERALKRIG